MRTRMEARRRARRSSHLLAAGLGLLSIFASKAYGFIGLPTLATRRAVLHPQSMTATAFQSSLRNPISAAAEKPGSADLDWANLGFEFRATKSHIKFVWKDGKWSEGELVSEPYVKVHIANTGLHYGQSIFEGLKAFTWKDGSVRIFRPYENAKRLRNSAERLMMTPFLEEAFVEAVKRVVADNAAYVPPFGDYYKGGLSPVSALIIDDFDRAAPRGVGNVKVAGNYAADLLPNMLGKKKGFPIGLYLDAKTNSYVEEFSTSNFVAISKDGAFISPDSPTVLPSITKKSLLELAEDEGLKVQERAIPVTELKGLKEVAACGTAVVVTPVNRIVYKDEIIKIGDEATPIGPITQKLYNRVRAIQLGEEEDKFGWTVRAV